VAEENQDTSNFTAEDWEKAKIARQKKIIGAASQGFATFPYRFQTGLSRLIEGKPETIPASTASVKAATPEAKAAQRLFPFSGGAAPAIPSSTPFNAPAAAPSAPVAAPTVNPAPPKPAPLATTPQDGGQSLIGKFEGATLPAPEPRKSSLDIPGVMPRDTNMGENTLANIKTSDQAATDRAVATSLKGDAQAGSDLNAAESPGLVSRIGSGIGNLLKDASMPGDQKAHLTALAFGLGLLKNAGTYSPIPVTAGGAIGEAGLGALQLYMHMDESEKATALKNAKFAAQLQKDMELVRHHGVTETQAANTLEETKRSNIAKENAPHPTTVTVAGPTGEPELRNVNQKELGLVGKVPVKGTMIEGQFPKEGTEVRGTAPVSPYTGKPIGEVTPLTPGKPYEMKIGNTVNVYEQGKDGMWRSKEHPDMAAIKTEKMKEFSERRQLIDHEEASIHNTMKNISGLTESDLAKMFAPDAKGTDAMAIMAKAKIGDKEREEYLKQIDRVRQKRSKLEAELTGKAPMGSLSKASNPASWE
jgi:hypothetical protein